MMSLCPGNSCKNDLSSTKETALERADFWSGYSELFWSGCALSLPLLRIACGGKGWQKIDGMKIVNTFLTWFEVTNNSRQRAKSVNAKFQPLIAFDFLSTSCCYWARLSSSLGDPRSVFKTQLLWKSMTDSLPPFFQRWNKWRSQSTSAERWTQYPVILEQLL